MIRGPEIEVIGHISFDHFSGVILPLMVMVISSLDVVTSKGQDLGMVFAKLLD